MEEAAVAAAATVIPTVTPIVAAAGFSTPEISLVVTIIGLLFTIFWNWYQTNVAQVKARNDDLKELREKIAQVSTDLSVLQQQMSPFWRLIEQFVLTGLQIPHNPLTPEEQEYVHEHMRLKDQTPLDIMRKARDAYEKELRENPKLTREEIFAWTLAAMVANARVVEREAALFLSNPLVKGAPDDAATDAA